MPLITDATQAREVFAEARERGAALLNLNPEAPRGIEACLRAAKAYGEQVGVDDLPFILSICGVYGHRPQIKLYTSLGDPLLGFAAWFSQASFYCDPDGPFGKLRVITHLDHGQPDGDKIILEEKLDRLGSVMFDASTLPIDENIEATAAYVERHHADTVIEGCVDEIFDSGTGEQKNEPTTVEHAQQYVEATGVDLIVPNLGTEHRASARDIHYHGDRAREISAAVGKILVLHGTSSLSPDDFASLRHDGIIKVNLWTAVEKAGAQAAVRNAINLMGNIYSQEELQGLSDDGLLGQRYFESDYVEEVADGRLYPKLNYFAECVRRDAWVDAAQELVESCFRDLGYEAFAQ